MLVSLKRTTSPSNVIDKSFKGDVVNTNCVMKDDTSITNPTLTFTGLTSAQIDFSNYNYVTIPQFDRSYFITDIRHDKNQVIISCHVDVLMSYKNDIKNSIQIVSRQESLKNRYIVDDRLPIHSDSSYTTQDINIPQLTCPNGGILLQVATG